MVLRAGESEIKVLAASVPDENPHPGLQMNTFFLCPHMAETEREKASSLRSPLIRTLIP